MCIIAQKELKYFLNNIEFIENQIQNIFLENVNPP